MAYVETKEEDKEVVQLLKDTDVLQEYENLRDW